MGGEGPNTQPGQHEVVTGRDHPAAPRTDLIVLDASAALDVVLQRKGAAQIDRLIATPGESLHAPHVIDLEVIHGLRRLTAARDLAPDRGDLAVRDFRELKLNRYGHLRILERIWELRFNLTAYDAAYVALAEMLDAPLITCDGRLARASGHRAKITLIA